MSGKYSTVIYVWFQTPNFGIVIMDFPWEYFNGKGDLGLAGQIIRQNWPGKKCATLVAKVSLCILPSLKKSLRLIQALFLRAPFWSKKENICLFSSLLPRFDKYHETSRMLPKTEQTFASARIFGVISWASFSRKNVPVGLGLSLSKSPVKV